MNKPTISLGTIHPRIRWLVVAHAILAALSLLVMCFQFNEGTLPLFLILSSLPLGSLMTLSVWIGMGQSRWWWRLTLGLVAIFYLSGFSLVVDLSFAPARLPIGDWMTEYLQKTAELTALLLLLVGMFMLIGRRFALLQLKSHTLTHSGRLQFSMLQIMVAMSTVAIILSLLREVRAASGHEPSNWETITIYSFLFVTYLVNTVCAAFATLESGQVKRNVALVLVVTILLGIVTAIAMFSDLSEWWFFLGSMLFMIVPTVIVLVSLLVVRSCGYRLVRRDVGAGVSLESAEPATGGQ